MARILKNPYRTLNQYVVKITDGRLVDEIIVSSYADIMTHVHRLANMGIYIKVFKGNSLIIDYSYAKEFNATPGACIRNFNKQGSVDLQ